MRLRAALVLVLALAGLFAAPAAVASAAAPSYPTTTCATLYVSTTHPLPGAMLTVSGKEFLADAAVTLKIKKPSIVLERVTTGADGSFSTTVKLPDGLTGNRIFTAVGGQDSTCPVDPIQLFIQSGSPNGAGVPSNGSTAFTGVDVAALVAIAVGLVGAGVLLNRRSRSSKRSASIS